MSDCLHEEFEVFAKIGRFADQDTDKVTHFGADIKIRCKQCQLPFEWIGVPMGFAFTGPHCSVDLLELRAPIRPQGASIVEEVPMPGFTIRERGC